jgi:predicted ATP-grasp superfamily ATP-dependent carboligase
MPRIEFNGIFNTSKGDPTCQVLLGVNVRAAARAAETVKEEAAVAVSTAGLEDSASAQPAAIRRRISREPLL